MWGCEIGLNHHATTAATMTSAAPIAQSAVAERAGLDESTGAGIAVLVFPEVISRFRRFRSARISAALWQRTSRSFSRALLIILSRSRGSSGCIRVRGAGGLFKMASKIAAVVSPRKGRTPVADLY